MTERSEHGGGDDAIRRELEEITEEEHVRAERMSKRWRRFIRNLRDLSEGGKP
jgi:hypothetical protein